MAKVFDSEKWKVRAYLRSDFPKKKYGWMFVFTLIPTVFFEYGKENDGEESELRVYDLTAQFLFWQAFVTVLHYPNLDSGSQ